MRKLLVTAMLLVGMLFGAYLCVHTTCTTSSTLSMGNAPTAAYDMTTYMRSMAYVGKSVAMLLDKKHAYVLLYKDNTYVSTVHDA